MIAFKNYKEALSALMEELNGKLDNESLNVIVKLIESIKDINNFLKTNKITEARPCGKFEVLVECDEIDYNFVKKYLLNLKTSSTPEKAKDEKQDLSYQSEYEDLPEYRNTIRHHNHKRKKR